MGRYSVGIVSLRRSTNNEDQPMNRIVASIASLAEHLLAVATDPEVYRPAACPHCGLAGVWRHGCYHRKVDRGDEGRLNRLDPVPVLRFLCRACVRTCCATQSYQRRGAMHAGSREQVRTHARHRKRSTGTGSSRLSRPSSPRSTLR